MDDHNDEMMLLEGIAAEDSEFFMELRDEMKLEVAYDPLTAPEPEIWLSSDEGGRNLAVIQYHLKNNEPWGPSLRLHAHGHVAAEDQLARGFQPSHAAMAQLMDSGLDRHAALHVVAACVIGVLRKAMRGKLSGSPDDMLASDLQDAVDRTLAG